MGGFNLNMAPCGVLVCILAMYLTTGLAYHQHLYYDPEEPESMFMLGKSKELIKTEAGEVRILKRGYKEQEEEERGGIRRGQLEIGFITMEPKSYFLPHFFNSDMVFFVETGSAKVGWVHKNDLIEQNLKLGDIYRIPGGSVFYLINTHKGQRLHIIYSVDTSGSLVPGKIQSFFVAGGLDPVSVLSGFDDHVLSGAFNVSRSELQTLREKQSRGAIIYLTEKQHEKEMSSWFNSYGSSQWRFLLESFINRKRTARKFNSYNIFDKTKPPGFKNDYGWSIAISNDDYSSLNEPDIGVFYVNLSAGAMLAHHYNPRGTEYGIITRGEGRIQIAFPNGSSAMDMEVGTGNAFWVPQYYPVCQIAARSGPLEFFGFTTSARGNRPQFLTGRNSVFNIMGSRNLAMAFNISEERVREILRAQDESVILPPLNPKKKAQEEAGEGGKGKKERGKGEREEEEEEKGEEGEKEKERGKGEREEEEEGRREGGGEAPLFSILRKLH